jgi:hypothetical protein
MTPANAQCPVYGAFSTFLHSVNAYKCFACRRSTYHECFKDEPDYVSWL